MRLWLKEQPRNSLSILCRPLSYYSQYVSDSLPSPFLNVEAYVPSISNTLKQSILYQPTFPQTNSEIGLGPP